MKRTISLIILIIAVSAGIYFYSQSEAQKVKGRITGLAGRVSKVNGEAVVKTALRLRGVGGYFGDPVLFEIETYELSGVYTPDEAARLAGTASAQFKTITLKFYDIKVDFLDDEFALVAATAIITGRMRSGETFDEAKEVDMELVKAGREWYITRISTVDVLEK